MTPARVVVVLAVLVSTQAFAEVPARYKAKRLAPAEPSPASVAVPEEVRASVAGSCSDAAAGTCADYEGAFTGRDLKGACETAKGTWASSPCPAAGSIGTCTQRQDGSEDRILTRSYAPLTAESARKACVSLPRGIFLQAK